MNDTSTRGVAATSGPVGGECSSECEVAGDTPTHLHEVSTTLAYLNPPASPPQASPGENSGRGRDNPLAPVGHATEATEAAQPGEQSQQPSRNAVPSQGKQGGRMLPHSQRRQAPIRRSPYPPTTKPLAPCAVTFPGIRIRKGMAFASTKGGVMPSGGGSEEQPQHGAAVLLQPIAPRLANRVTHPQGFRILKDSSVLERTMRGYFRLPSAPNPRLLSERRRLQRTLLRVERDELAETARVTGGTGGVILDGFLLLSASAADDPAAVEAVTLQASHLVAAVPEDLTYFTNLRFLDVSENELALADVVSLPALETLHMACNRMHSLAGLLDVMQRRRTAGPAASGVQDRLGGSGAAGSTSWGVRSIIADRDSDDDDEGRTEDAGEGGVGEAKLHATAASRAAQRAAKGHFATQTSGSALSSTVHDVLLPSLAALNLSYNVIPPGHLHYLACFPCLEKLDLSGNNLRALPSDLSSLTSVTHLALEGNDLGSSFAASRSRAASDRSASAAVFLSLSTMPSLVEVNLNHNKLTRVPPLSVQDGRDLCFPSIEVVGLSGNRFKDTEDVAELASLHRTLRRVVLSHNPICHDTHRVCHTIHTFQQRIVDAYWERTARDRELELRRERQWQGRVSAESAGGDDIDAVPTDGQAHGEDDADDASWGHQGWSRLIPRRAEEEEEEEDSCGKGSVASRASLYDTPRDLDVSAAALAAATAATTALTSGHPNHSDGSGNHSSSNNGSSSSDSSSQRMEGDAKGHDGASTAWDRANHSAASRTGTTSLRDYYATVEDYLEAHYVNLIFQDAAMPKRDLRYFYATQARAHGQSTFVTIPEYEEFMDIYRITGRTKAEVRLHRRPMDGRTAKQSRGPLGNRSSRSSRRHPREWTWERESPSPVTGSVEEVPCAEEPVEESDLPKPSVGSGDNAAFFMTELDDTTATATASKAPPSPRKTMGSNSARPKSPCGSPAEPTAMVEKGHRSSHRPRDLAAPAPAAAVAAASLHRFPPVISDGAGGSVHSALGELKALLRRPLVPLPYAHKK